MKRAIALIVTLAIMLSAFSTLAYAQTPNCATHDPYLLLALGWGVEKDVSTRYEYEVIDGTKHLEKSISSIRCATCGELLTEITGSSTEDYHSFNSNSKCVLCGYQAQTFNPGGSRYDDWPGMENAKKCTNCGDTTHATSNCPYCEYCRMNTAYGHANNCPIAGGSRYDDWPGNQPIACQHTVTTEQKTNGYYQQVNDSYHTYNYSINHFCQKCGIIVNTTSGNERQQHSYYNNVCNQCGYRKTCSHSNVTSKTINESYKDTSSTYHTHYYTVVKTCRDCGVQVDSQQYNTKEKHSYQNGECTKCDHEKPCEHDDTRQVQVDSEYEEYSSSKHVKVKYYEEICNDCGETIDTYTEESKDSHSYNSNYKCKYCGYYKTDVYVPAIPSYTTDYEVVLKVGSKNAYVDGSKETLEAEVKNISSTTYIPAKAVTQALGGRLNSWNASDSSANFTLGQDTFHLYANSTYYLFNGRTNYFSNKVKIQNDTMYVGAKDYFGMFGKTVNYYEGYCVIVDDWLTEEEVKQVITKYYDEDYEERDNKQDVEQEKIEYYDEIKAEKLYVVGANNKLYQRKLDEESDIGYVDTYSRKVYTNLKEGTILIKRGSSYYDTNGNKVDLGTANTGSTGSTTKEDYVAQVGDNNSIVTEIQERLLELDYTSQLVTGYYGSITENNIKYFQKINGLPVTGNVDEETYQKLFYVEEEKTQNPIVSIIELVSDRNGIIYVHAIGNEETEKISISVCRNNTTEDEEPYADYTLVHDRECWFSTETPETGTYRVWAIAYSTDGTESEYDTQTIEVSKYSVIQKVFEDMGEEQQIGYEIQLGLFTALVENLVVKPTTSLVNGLDYIFSYPNVYRSEMRAEGRAEFLANVEKEIEEALPYGAGYYYVGQLTGNITSFAVDSIIVINGVKGVITGIKTLPSGIRVITAQIASAGANGGYTTIQVMVDGEAIASSVTAIAGGSASIAFVAASTMPESDWKDYDDVEVDKNEKPSSKTLEKNMELVGRNRPRNYRTAAHHIVAGTAKNAEDSREILRRFNISINNEANGVFLTIEKGVSNSAYHPSLHSKDYHDKVYKLLNEATTREEALAILRRIGEQLSRGNF